MVRKRKGTGEVERKEKYRNGKKKEGSRKGEENREVSEW
jgi:hypothetical protein